YEAATWEIKSQFPADARVSKQKLRLAAGTAGRSRSRGGRWVQPRSRLDFGRLDFDFHAALGAHLDQVLDLVTVLFGHLVHAFVIVRFAAVLQVDVGYLGLAVGDRARDRKDERAFLMACSKAIVGSEYRGHDLLAAGSAKPASGAVPAAASE